MRALLAFAGYCVLVVALNMTRPALAQTVPAAKSEPTPIQDDANLHDIQLMGAARAWVVGDHGVVWHTRDGGRHWMLQSTPVDCSLRSVCFLTDRVGWIAGERTIPYAGVGTGVVLSTANGGETWQLVSDKLPRLYHVQFFDLKHGVAVGDSRPDQPAGVFVTEDGGHNWQPVPGDRQDGWRAADFLSVETGAVAGRRGSISLVGEGALQAPRIDRLGLQGLRDIDLSRDGTGWLVGEGALVRRTKNAGLVWESAPTPLPAELRDFFDFRTVTSVDGRVWLAGSPGSVIWHSPDGGRSWNKQPTGQPLPINGLRFTDERIGWAVGDLGTVLATNDGGRTWHTIKGAGRRAALLGLHASPGRVSLRLVAQQSAELGYRSVMLLPSRHDTGANQQTERSIDARLHEAVVSAGGSAAEIDWQFPLERPEHARDLDRLVADWNRRTEGRLKQVFVGKLVCRLRTWRPSVVIVGEAAPDDALAKLIQEAALQAVQRAADPSFHLAQRELADLGPWQVERVYLRLADGSSGEIDVDPSEYLRRMGVTVQTAASAAEGILKGEPVLAAARETYRLIYTARGPTEAAISTDFFTNLPIAPGSDARRQIAPIDTAAEEARLELARRQRNVQAYAERYFDEPEQGAQVLAHFRQLSHGFPDDQAAVQLAQLADAYRERGRWDLVEATYVEMVSRYPDEPVTLDAMRWLMQLWSGLEPAWQRVRAETVKSQRTQVGKNGGGDFIRLAGLLASDDPELPEFDRNQAEGAIKINGSDTWRAGTVSNWHEQAVTMAARIREKSPALYRTPEIQFPLASLMRQRGMHNMADRFYGRFQRSGGGDAWNTTAAAEIWLLAPVAESPKPTALCRRAAERPMLDGLLSDACWQDAQEIRLTTADAAEQSEYAFAMLSYDDEFLYVALTVPNSPELPVAEPAMPGRTHDADLTGHDRVTLFLDVDRDYETFYAIHVDQRGWVAEQCWNDASWNPRMFVHAEANADRWRIEAAIPFEELVPSPPASGIVWAAGIVRTIPGVGWESWTHPAGSEPSPESFSLLRFH